MTKQNLVTQVISIDKDKKEELTDIFKDNGLTFTSGVRLILYQYLDTQKEKLAKQVDVSYSELNELVKQLNNSDSTANQEVDTQAKQDAAISKLNHQLNQ